MKLRLEDRLYHMTGKLGAGMLVIGILTLVGGLVLGTISIVNGGILLKAHSDLLKR